MSEYPGAYEAYLIEFHATRDYFECHELLEEYWKSLPQGEEGRDVWVGLIQLAVAQYHHRRGNRAGAQKMFRQAARRLDAGFLGRLGLDGDAVRAAVNERIDALERSGESAPFSEFDLPLADPQLLRRLTASCKSRGLVWGAPSRPDAALVERHMRRDRTDVVEAREAAMMHRRSQRGS